MDRRSFIKTAAAASLGAGLSPLVARAEMPVPYPLVRTGQQLFIHRRLP